MKGRPNRGAIRFPRPAPGRSERPRIEISRMDLETRDRIDARMEAEPLDRLAVLSWPNGRPRSAYDSVAQASRPADCRQECLPSTLMRVFGSCAQRASFSQRSPGKSRVRSGSNGGLKHAKVRRRSPQVWEVNADGCKFPPSHSPRSPAKQVLAFGPSASMHPTFFHASGERPFGDRRYPLLGRRV